MIAFDLFACWRYLLSVLVTIYVVAYTARTLWGYLLWFRSSRRFEVMGHYAVVLLLRARLRKFSGELVQIALLLALLGGVMALHWVLL